MALQIDREKTHPETDCRIGRLQIQDIDRIRISGVWEIRTSSACYPSARHCWSEDWPRNTPPDHTGSEPPHYENCPALGLFSGSIVLLLYAFIKTCSEGERIALLLCNQLF